MKIGGLQKLSLVDYPGKVAASVFTIGCNFRCGFCHNPELVLPEEYTDELSEKEVLDFLTTRIGKLDGVAISGGEPTLHKDLPDFITKIKKMGYAVKLDSQGSNPDMLEKLFDESLIDFIAMDVKGPLEKYSKIMSWEIDPEIIKRSINLIMNSGRGYEFRTTVVKSQLDINDFHKVGEMINGSRRYALQKFKPNVRMVDTKRFKNELTYSDEDFDKIKKIMEKYVETCIIH